jgi:hypothetical protein
MTNLTTLYTGAYTLELISKTYEKKVHNLIFFEDNNLMGYSAIFSR